MGEPSCDGAASGPQPRAPAEPVLRAEGITVRAGGVTLLRDVGLEVAAGEILGVFGPSGAGKSTLFRTLAGEERPAAGRVWIDGADVSRRPLWERARLGLGYLPQTPSLLWDLTVAENLAVFRRLGRTVDDPGELLQALGLGGHLDVIAGALSGGERRRLELCRAMAARPRVLLCDEPFAAIDPAGAAKVAERLAGLAAGGSAVILADHHVGRALGLCRRAALLLGGEITAVGTPEDFSRHPDGMRHYAPAEGV
jgi:lipopolysaccharide export system ATP-binding protein